MKFNYIIIINKTMVITQDWEPVTIGNGKKNKVISSSAPKPKIIQDDEDAPKIQKYPVELIKNLKEARAAKGLTQKDLANKMCINVSMIQNLENNECNYNRSKTFYISVMKTLGANINLKSLPKL